MADMVAVSFTGFKLPVAEAFDPISDFSNTGPALLTVALNLDRDLW